MSLPFFTNNSEFELLYDKYAPLLYGMIRQKIRDEKTAKKILLAVFQSVYDNRNQYPSFTGTLFTWLHQITTRQLAIHFKSKSQVIATAIAATF